LAREKTKLVNTSDAVAYPLPWLLGY